MKELRPLDVVLKEIMDTATDVAGLAMYQHPFFHGLTMPRRADIPKEVQGHFPCLEQVVESTINAWNQAVCEGDHDTAIMIVTPRPFRLHRFLDWDLRMAWDCESDRLELIRDLWIDAEHPHINIDTWRHLWQEVAKSYYHEHIYTMKEMNQREMQDEEFTLYRGTNQRERVLGLSWTTDRERAEWFARRWQASGMGAPRVYELTTTIDKTVGPLLQRGEDEYILVDPSKPRVREHFIERESEDE
mgnify:CR=1 FL=1